MSATFPDKKEVTVAGDSDPVSQIERLLQNLYGSGTYISDYYETDSGVVSIEVGNSFPKDVTDCRPGQSRVIKYIAVDNIGEVRAVRDENTYALELPTREEVNRGLIEGKDRLRDQFDQAMAKASYKQIATTPAVENQLNPIKQILRWTRRYHPVPFEKVRAAQNKEDEKTLRYVHTLEELGFVELRRDGNIYALEPLDKYDFKQISGEEFTEKILGEVIEQGFKRLSRDLGLGILRNLPKFANGYYLDAIEREDPDLHLDRHAIHENIKKWYGSSERRHRYILEDKLQDLVSLGILSMEEEPEATYYTADDDTYDRVKGFAGV